jgi:hypothetical protein
MTIKKLSIEETIQTYTNENGFAWGINTVMKSLAPDASYDLTSVGGTFIVDRWDSSLPQPTSQEIRDEYIRQQTIAECLKYFKENTGFRGLIKKLFKVSKV